MSAGITEVILTAIFFLVATFAIGVIPIYFFKKKLDTDDMYLTAFSLFGVGMLLGTSFMLVIPEGVYSCLEHDGNVGLNLLIGFLAVHLLDHFVKWVGKASKEASWASFMQQDPELNSFKDLLNFKKTSVLVIKNNVVFALVVHGLSDGLALGASITNDSLKVIMLIAIIVHKIPAVLSLTSLMVSKQKLPPLVAVSNLLAFAASTPVGYIVVSLLNLGNWKAMEWISGNLLLMSGGSLLYASFTAFLGNDNHHLETRNDGFVVVDGAPSTEPVKDVSDVEINSPSTSPTHVPYGETIYVMAGVLIPTVISFFVNEG